MEALAVQLTELTSWQQLKLAAVGSFSGDLLPPSCKEYEFRQVANSHIFPQTFVHVALKHEASIIPFCIGWPINSYPVKKSKVTSVFWKKSSPVLHDIDWITGIRPAEKIKAGLGYRVHFIRIQLSGCMRTAMLRSKTLHVVCTCMVSELTLWRMFALCLATSHTVI